MPHTVYLAGPEVFLPNGRDLIERKRQLAREYGLEPTSLHAELGERDETDPSALGHAISLRNEELMNAADVCIANLTPFRGISADVGTVFELGYMAAQGKAVFGYTNDPRDYAERADEYYGGLVRTDDGRLRGPDQQFVEEHGMFDNLMMEGGVVRRGGVIVRADEAAEWDDLTAFTRCLAEARERLDA